jgi:hypothetical protein
MNRNTFFGMRTHACTSAAWPVWSDSIRAEVRFQPMTKRNAVRLWHRARDFERQTRQRNRQDGAIGRNGLAILQALLFDFMNYRSGALYPSWAAIARAAGISERSVGRGLAKLREAGVLHWLRRCIEEWIDGRFTLRQQSNAYAVCPTTQWRGYVAPVEPPNPAPGTWGDHPPIPGFADDRLAQALDRLGGFIRTASLTMKPDLASPQELGRRA